MQRSFGKWGLISPKRWDLGGGYCYVVSPFPDGYSLEIRTHALSVGRCQPHGGVLQVNRVISLCIPKGFSSPVSARSGSLWGEYLGLFHCDVPGGGMCCVLLCDEVLGSLSLVKGWHPHWGGCVLSPLPTKAVAGSIPKCLAPAGYRGAAALLCGDGQNLCQL